MEGAGLPKCTFHSLRHSHASALIHAGLDVMRVSKQLGHSNPAITFTAYAQEFKKATQARRMPTGMTKHKYPRFAGKIGRGNTRRD